MFKNIAEATAKLGEAKVLNLINTAVKNAEYRKSYNVRRQDKLDRLAAIENDPKLAEQLQRILAARSKV